MKPNATTWVSKDKDGKYVAIKVSDMEDSHLWRWIRYFRRKWRDGGFNGDDEVLDTIIQLSMPTAPAIYARAKERGVISLPDPPKEPPGSPDKFVKLLRETNPGVMLFISRVHYTTTAMTGLTVRTRHEQEVAFLMSDAVMNVLRGVAWTVWKREMAIDIIGPTIQVEKNKAKTASPAATMSVEVDVQLGVRRITFDEED
jgi:hypothetical protein